MNPNFDLIVRLERIAFNAWVAKEIEQLGGWYLRSNDDVTRRANSVLPLGVPSIDIHKAINYAKRFYQERKIMPRFQLTPVSQPEGLDDLLEDAGFKKGMTVTIQTGSTKRAASGESCWEVDITDRPSAEFLKCYAEASRYDDNSLRVRKGIMERIAMKKAFALVKVDGVVAGVGIAVVEDEWVGFFSLVTREQYRRTGISTSINQELARWALDLGASRCYLQVLHTNLPAIALYSRLGFEELYRYWYRVYGTPIIPSH